MNLVAFPRPASTVVPPRYPLAGWATVRSGPLGSRMPQQRSRCGSAHASFCGVSQPGWRGLSPLAMGRLFSPTGFLARFGQWLAEAINHAFGNPREERSHRPPPVGVPPYRDRPRRRSR